MIVQCLSSYDVSSLRSGILKHYSWFMKPLQPSSSQNYCTIHDSVILQSAVSSRIGIFELRSCLSVMLDHSPRTFPDGRMQLFQLMLLCTSNCFESIHEHDCVKSCSLRTPLPYKLRDQKDLAVYRELRANQG